MALRIRLARGGAKKRPFYHIVVTPSTSPRDGRFIERLGTYNPMLPREHADRITLKEDRIRHWLSNGAVPTDRVGKFLGQAGIIAMPEAAKQSKQHLPKAKAQERMKAEQEAAAAAAKAAEEGASDAS